jgi:hypothetical protein
MIMVNGHMSSIIECDNCGYSRSSEDDGRQFIEVCSICYKEDCKTPTTPIVICNDCDTDPIIDPGESLFT